jgi:hypothetical protein
MTAVRIRAATRGPSGLSGKKGLAVDKAHGHQERA